MFTAQLRKVGGSVMLTVPPAVLDALEVGVGARVNMVVDNGRLVVERQPRPRYTLAELLAASDYAQPRTDEEEDWLASPGIGRELV